MKRLLRFCCLTPLLFLALAAAAQPTADFSASPLSGCAPLTVYFTDQSSGAITSYNWNLGGSSSGFQNPSKTFTASGNYTISLTVTGPGGTDTKTQSAYITVYKKPYVNFTANLTPASGCLPLQVQFTPIVTLNQPGPPTYTWDFGDGSPTSNAVSPVHTYTTTGPFSVTLTVGGQYCDSSITKSSFITTYTPPIAQFVSDYDYLCAQSGTITFTNNSSGGPFSTVFWRFGDNTTGTGSPISHTYTTPATAYDVALIVTDVHGCMDSAKSNAYIKKYLFTPSFTSANAVCEGTPITFFNTTGGTLSSSDWAYGDGGTDQGVSAAHTYNSSGNFTVTLSTGVGPCVKTTTKSITVNPKPVISIGFTPAIPCPAPVGVTFTATNTNTAITNPLTYDWDFGDGNIALNANPAIDTYRTNGYKKVQVTATDALTGCTSVGIKDSVPIRKIIPPCNACLHILFANPQEGCAPLTSIFSASLGSSLPPPPGPMDPPAPYPVPIATYNWTFFGGVNGSSTAATPADTFKTIGTYKVKLTAITANGCPVVDSIYVHADGVVKPGFFAVPDSVCPKQPVTFYDTTAIVSGTTYSWNLGDTSFAHTNANFKASFTHSYRKSGAYTVALSTNHNGCDTTVSKTAYIYVRPASADFNYFVQCPPKKAPFVYGVTFTDASIGATAWNWNFGDGTGSTLQNPPIHYYNTTGVFQIRLIASNSTYGCPGDTVVRAVTTYNSSLQMAVDDDSLCLGEEAKLNGTFVGAAAASYSWYFDNDPTTQTPYVTDNKLTYVFPTAGLHTVTLVTASGPGNACLDTLTIPDFILVSHPVIKFGASPGPIGCSPYIVTLRDSTKPTATTTIISREWDFGDGSSPLSGNVANPTHTYLTGTYSVNLKVTDNLGCSDEMVKTDYIEVRHPTAIFNAANSKTTICAHDSLLFINSSTGVAPLTYLWSFGDGTTSTTFQPKKAYPAAGIYSVRLIVFDVSGCSDTVLLSNYITVLAPKAAFTMDKSIATCTPLTVNFTNASIGAVKYNWDFEPGAAPNALPNPTHTFATAGIFNVVLTATDTTGCKDTAQRQVYVLGYAGAFTTTPSDICAGQSTTFSASIANVPKIFWDFNDGTGDTSNSPVITHTYSTPGTYFPLAIFSDGSPNCKSVSNAIIPVRVDKVSAGFSTSVPCVDSPFTLTTTSTALFSQPNIWNWYFTPAGTATGATVQHTFGTSGPHAVTIVAANGWGCRDTLTKEVFINPLPIVDAGPVDTGICPGDTIMLVGHGAVSYQWTSDAPVICATCPVAQVFTAAPTTYFVTGTDANGCKNRDSITARIQIKTTSSVSQGGDICIGETFRLNAAGATSYSWQPVRFLDSPNIASPLATPITTTAYVVTAKEGTCLERYDTVVVTVHPTPVFFSAGQDEIINYGSSVILQASTSGIATIRWRPDSTLSCLDCFRPVAKPYVTTKYYAVGYSQWGCADSAEVTVRVRCNGDSVFIPNTFTPNGDGYNDVFYPRGKGIVAMRAVRIYNRWGELVYEHTDLSLNDEHLGWDGTFKGHTLPPDVYMYTMQSRCPDGGELVEWKGDITLLR